MKAAAYIRVSTQEQAGEDHFGLDAQREAIKDFSAREGLEIVAWYVDEGISGASLDRPGLQAMLAQGGSYDVVPVAKMDRVARDLMAQLWIEKELLKQGAEIISAAEPFRGQDPASVLFRQMIGAFAQFEKSRIAERMTGGRKQKAKTGGYAGGRAPIGYKAKRGDKALRIDKNKVATVKRVFDIRKECPDWTLQAIAEQLNQEGHSTAQAKPFRKTQVWRILDQASLYRGEYRYAGVEAKGTHASIL